MAVFDRFDIYVAPSAPIILLPVCFFDFVSFRFRVPFGVASPGRCGRSARDCRLLSHRYAIFLRSTGSLRLWWDCINRLVNRQTKSLSCKRRAFRFGNGLWKEFETVTRRFSAMGSVMDNSLQTGHSRIVSWIGRKLGGKLSRIWPFSINSYLVHTVTSRIKSGIFHRVC